MILTVVVPLDLCGSRSRTDDNGVEYILRMLQLKKIPFTSYDIASDEDAKKLWRRKAPLCEYPT